MREEKERRRRKSSKAEGGEARENKVKPGMKIKSNIMEAYE